MPKTEWKTMTLYGEP